jgi:thymidylate synthase ThyX
MSRITTIHISGTLRDLLGFINIRADPHSKKEARDIALAIGGRYRKELLSYSKDYWEEGMFYVTQNAMLTVIITQNMNDIEIKKSKYRKGWFYLMYENENPTK